MYYVLRTHGSFESHWGFTCIAIVTTKKQAKHVVKDMLAKELSKDTYIITKLVTGFKYSNISDILNPIWEVKEL